MTVYGVFQVLDEGADHLTGLYLKEDDANKRAFDLRQYDNSIAYVVVLEVQE